MRLVLNRANSQLGITAGDVENILDMRVTSHIPSDGHVVVKSVNSGTPFVLSAPDTEIAQSIMNLGRELLGKYAPSMMETAVNGADRSRGGLWQFLFGD
jgi:pilus assembly protein CpaE